MTNIERAKKGMVLSEREALDELLSIYTARGRDKTLPIKIIMEMKQLKAFAEMDDINGKRWRYRGFVLERAAVDLIRHQV